MVEFIHDPRAEQEIQQKSPRHSKFSFAHSFSLVQYICEEVGAGVGCISVGPKVGFNVGDKDGDVGALEGEKLGALLGGLVGFIVGDILGDVVGSETSKWQCEPAQVQLLETSHFSWGQSSSPYVELSASLSISLLI
jgi:hypothetical protein